MTTYKRRRGMTYDPVWKREIPEDHPSLASAVDDAANVMSEYNQQLPLDLNTTKEATPEEFAEWQEKELNWWADRQLTFVGIAAIVQLTALGFMASVMLVADLAFK